MTELLWMTAVMPAPSAIPVTPLRPITRSIMTSARLSAIALVCFTSSQSAKIISAKARMATRMAAWSPTR